LEVGVKVGYSAPQIQEIIDKLAFTIIPFAPEMDFSVLPYEVRDKMDLPILAAALKIDSDIILTGNKDLLALGLKRPQIMNPADFLRNFSE
jgi:predicted nucleic acid-binding protein